jgi:ABC-2 type transport system permease protein
MTAEARTDAVARIGRSRTTPVSRLFGLGSLFGKSLRDSRRAIILVGVVLVLIAIAAGSQLTNQFPTEALRAQIVGQVSQLPAIFRGLLGDPINATTLGGFLSWRTLNSMPLFLGLWSILALSSTLAGEARRGSLEVLLGTPLSRRGIAAQKVAAHLVAVAIAMVIAALGFILAGSAFATLPGDAITPAAAFGHAAWLFLTTVIGGAAAFAASPFVSRAAGAGIGALVLFGSFIVSAFRESIPVFEPLSQVSFFRSTAGHRPLAGVTDWPSMLILGAVVLGLILVGIEAFARRDVGRPISLAIGRLPRPAFTRREPLGRMLGDRAIAAVAWGVGIGLYGLTIAASSPSFAEQLNAIPQIREVIARVYPGIDFSTAGGVLQLIFFSFATLLFGFAGASFVGGWTSEETERRLDVVLSTPISRVGWALRAGLGTYAAILVFVTIVATLVAIGAGLAGSPLASPIAGTYVGGIYALAIAGIGLAVGGAWRPGPAAMVAGAFVIGFYVFDLLGAILGLPTWLTDLSLTKHLGQPMAGIFDPGGIIACVVLAVGGLAIAALGLRRRDLRG